MIRKKEIIKDIKKKLLELRRLDRLKRHYYMSTEKDLLEEYFEKKLELILSCSRLLGELKPGPDKMKYREELQEF